MTQYTVESPTPDQLEAQRKAISDAAAIVLSSGRLPNTAEEQHVVYNPDTHFMRLSDKMIKKNLSGGAANYTAIRIIDLDKVHLGSIEFNENNGFSIVPRADEGVNDSDIQGIVSNAVLKNLIENLGRYVGNTANCADGIISDNVTAEIFHDLCLGNTEATIDAAALTLKALSIKVKKNATKDDPYLEQIFRLTSEFSDLFPGKRQKIHDRIGEYEDELSAKGGFSLATIPKVELVVQHDQDPNMIHGMFSSEKSSAD